MTKTTKVRITLVAEVDIDSWRREYGQPETTVSEIREAVRADIDQNARMTYPVSTFGSMVLVRTAE